MKQTADMTELSREIGEIWARLFDHRPYLNGEIKSMVKEFEEKRGDREVENLFSILEKVTEVKDTEFEKIKKASDLSLPRINTQFNVALDLFSDIAKNSQTFQESNSKKVLENRSKRNEEWNQFLNSYRNNKLISPKKEVEVSRDLK